MMKAIFLCDCPENVSRAFDEKTKEALRSTLGLSDTVYKKADVLSAKNLFCDVEFIFSTWGMPIFSETEIEKCFPRLLCVFYAAGSVQAFARPFLKKGVKVFSAWAANAVPVAEMTVAEIVLANKGFFASSRLCKAEKREKAGEFFRKCRGNYGETVGIIGAGMIGRLVTKMLASYDLNVIVFDPFLSDSEADLLGVRKCSLDEIFETAFVVSNHLANNKETRGMLNYRLFSKMRENAVFINTGRGAQVVESDLCRILSERPDLSALLDVTDPEPSVAGHPFYSLPNCILTPHIAGSAGNEVARMGQYMQAECEAFLKNEATHYEVTEKMLETMA